MFLLHHHHTPLDSGYSPSKLLNGHQIHWKLDALFPSPHHVAQGKQMKEATSHRKEHNCETSRLAHQYTVGSPCYALYCGPRCNKQSRWVPAVVAKVFEPWSVNMQVNLQGPTWHWHIKRLCPRHGVEEGTDIGGALTPTKAYLSTQKGDNTGTISTPKKTFVYQLLWITFTNQITQDVLSN